jgi:hypothetical protein
MPLSFDLDLMCWLIVVVGCAGALIRSVIYNPTRTSHKLENKYVPRNNSFKGLEQSVWMEGASNAVVWRSTFSELCYFNLLPHTYTLWDIFDMSSTINGRNISHIVSSTNWGFYFTSLAGITVKLIAAILIQGHQRKMTVCGSFTYSRLLLHQHINTPTTHPYRHTITSTSLSGKTFESYWNLRLLAPKCLSFFCVFCADEFFCCHPKPNQ